MKGIVLSFDPHLEIANLVVETYNQLWPDHRFQFRIPFTNRDPRSIFRAQNVEFISTLPDITAVLFTRMIFDFMLGRGSKTERLSI